MTDPAGQVPAPGSARRAAAAFVLTLCLQQALAEHTVEGLDEGDYLAPIPIVLSTTHLRQPVDETPTATTVIDHATIVASGATEIADLLRLVPGFQVGHALGNQFAVTYHGHASTFPRHMQVLIDGRSVYSPLFSIVDWNHIGLTIEDIERIEVVRGSNTPINGTNAFVATINFITRQPFQDHGITVKATAGSNETRREFLRLSGSVGDFDHRLTLEHREDDGFDSISDSRQLTQANYRGSYFASANDAFDIQLGHAEGPMGLGSDEAKKLSPVRRKQTRSHYAFVRWRHTLANDDEFFVQAYDNFLEWRDDKDILGPLSDIFAVPSATIPGLFHGNPDQKFDVGEFSGRAVRQDIELRYHAHVDDGLQGIWGLGLRADHFTSPSNLSRLDSIDNSSHRLFGHLEWRLAANLLVNAGAMLEHNGIGGTEVSPRLALNLLLDPEQSIHFAVTRSARMPSILEARQFHVIRFASGDILDFRFDSALDLRPEHISAYELGYTYHLPVSGLHVEGKLFHEQITDIIASPTVHFYPDPDVPTAHAAEATLPYLTAEELIALNKGKPADEKAFVWMNAGHLDRSGLDLGLDYIPNKTTRLRLAYGYAAAEGRLLKRIDRGTTIVDSEDEQNSVPRHTLSLLLSRQLTQDLLTSLAWYHVSPMVWLGDGDRVEGYDRVDLHLRQAITSSVGDIVIAVSIQNLFDDPYHEVTQYNVFHRRYFLELGLEI